MTLPPGYTIGHCPRCRAPFAMPETARASYCSLACAEAAQRPRPPLLRAVRCNYCQAPMQVEPRLRPPYRCPECTRRRYGPTSH